MKNNCGHFITQIHNNKTDAQSISNTFEQYWQKMQTAKLSNNLQSVSACTNSSNSAKNLM